jgi:peptidoglycan-associated lipoprotein
MIKPDVRALALPILICCAATLAGCRSHRHAVKPAVVPQQVAKAAAPPEVHVAPPADFVAPKGTNEDIGSDPTEATALADRNGWLRDAFFDFDSSVLTPAAQENLTDSAQWLRQHQKFHVLIEGHCDERGTEQYNLALGDHRAYEAKEYLATLGLDAAHMSTISYGKDRPFDPGHNEEAWAKNRRAHLVLTSSHTASK